MKIKRINSYKTKLLQLQLLKLYYKKESYNFKSSLKRLELYLSKISDTVYRYHTANKKILFLGFPKSFKKILKKTKHVIVPEHAWVNGMLSNRNQKINKADDSMDNRSSLSNKTTKLLSQLQKKIDLVVIYNLNQDHTAIKESFLGRIPVIAFTDQLKILSIYETYVSEGLHTFVSEKLLNNHFFFSIIETTLKRALRSKKRTKTRKNIMNISRRKKTFWNNKRHKKPNAFKKRIRQT